MTKYIIITLLLCTLSHTKMAYSFEVISTEKANDDLSNVLNDEILEFETHCIDNKTKEIKGDEFLPGTFQTCDSELKYINKQIEIYEESLLPENSNNQIHCKPTVYSQAMDNLAGIVGEVVPKVTCSQKELAAKEDSCADAWMCNAMRSVLTLSLSRAPKFIERSIRQTAQNAMSNNTKKCLSSEKEDCVSEIMSTVTGSLFSTAGAIWDLAKSGVKSLFEMDDWFSKTSDSLHMAAKESFSGVNNFRKDPGGWILKKVNSIYKSIRNWIMSGALCQKWAGEPHMSKCTQPSNGFGCLDCDSQINGICSAAGGILAEVGIGVLTAGTGTVASIGARVGVAAMRKVAVKTAAKIKIKTPSMPISLATNAVGPKTKKMFELSSSFTLKSKSLVADSIARFKQMQTSLTNNVVIAKTQKVLTKGADFIADPTGLITKISKKGVTVTAKLAENLGGRSVVKAAKATVNKPSHLITVKAKARPLRSTVKIAEIKSASLSSSSQHSVASTSSESIHSSPHNDSHHEDYNISDNNHSNTQDRELSSNNNSKSDHDENNESNEHNDTKVNTKVNATGFGLAQVKLIQNRANIILGKKSVNADIIATTKKIGEQKISSTAIKASAVVVTADMTQKIYQGDENFKQIAAAQNEKSNFVSEKHLAKIHQKLGSESVRSANELRNVIGNTGDLSSTSGRQLAKQKIKALGEVYSDKNKDQIVRQIRSTNHSISTEAATSIFNKRKAQIASASDFISNKRPIAQTTKNTTNSIQEKTSSAVQAHKLKAIIDDHYKKASSERKEKSDISSEVAKLKDQLDKLDDTQSLNNQNVSSHMPTNMDNTQIRSRSPSSVSTIKKRPSTNAPAVALADSLSLNSASSNTYEGNEPDNLELGTLHPDVIDDLNKSKNSESGSEEPIEKVQSGISYLDFMSELKDKDSQNILDIKKNFKIDKNNIKISSDKNRALATKFSNALEQFSFAESVKKVQSDGNIFKIFTFSRDQVYGVKVLANGFFEMLDEKELNQINI